MKKVTMIFALAAGLGFIISQTAQAIEPSQNSGLTNNDNAGIVLEKEIELQDWMLSPASFSKEKGIEIEQMLVLQDWMLDADWGQANIRLVSESEIELEDWMLNIFEFNNQTIALEDWMLRIAG